MAKKKNEIVVVEPDFIDVEVIEEATSWEFNSFAEEFRKMFVEYMRSVGQEAAQALAYEITNKLEDLTADNTAIESIVEAKKTGLTEATSKEGSDEKEAKKKESRLLKIAKGIETGIKKAGGVIFELGKSAMTSSISMESAMNSFAISTGKSTEEIERYQEVLEKIYKNNYGKDFQEIADAMGKVTKSLGSMDDSAFQKVTEAAFLLRDVFTYDIEDSTKAAKALMDSFGTSGETAMGLIAAGAMNGLDDTGKLLDGISDYSSEFAKVGLNADDMFQIFEAGAEMGTFSMEAIGNAMKEMSGRILHGSDNAQRGFKLLGLNADEMSAKFAAGTDSAREAYKQTMEAMAKIKDPLVQNAAGVELFGDEWKKLGPEVVKQLSEITDGVYDTEDALSGLKGMKKTDMSSMLEEMKRCADMLLLSIGEGLLPVLSELLEALMPIIEALMPIIEEFLPPLVEMIGEFIEQLKPIIEQLIPILTQLIEKLIPPIMSIIGAVLPVLIELMDALLPILEILMKLIDPIIILIMELLSPILDLISEAIVPLMRLLTPLIDLLVMALGPALVFVGKLIGSVFKDVGELISDIVNGVIDGINFFIRALNKIKIPDWVPGIGGKGFHFEEISKEGTSSSAQEQIVSKSIGGFEGIQQQLSNSAGNGDVYVNVNGSVDEDLIDYNKMGQATTAALQKAGLSVRIGEREFGRIVREVQ